MWIIGMKSKNAEFRTLTDLIMTLRTAGVDCSKCVSMVRKSFVCVSTGRTSAMKTQCCSKLPHTFITTSLGDDQTNFAGNGNNYLHLMVIRTIVKL